MSKYTEIKSLRPRLKRGLYEARRHYSSIQAPESRVWKHFGEYFNPIIAQGYRGIDKFSQLTQPKKLGQNQTFSTGNEANLQHLINNFHSDIKYSFGYGSGVFEQAGYTNIASKPQIDMVHIVDNTRNFHQTNLEQFPDHYSFLKYFGVGSIERFQNLGAGVYFNPYISMKNHDGNNNMIKYGVASTTQALTDICEWSNLYLAGRLQKPVRFLKEENHLLQNLNQYNLQSVTTLSLLLTKQEVFSENQLYETISLISYMGDPRMLVGGENPNKVKNIVSKQFDNFKELYGPIINYLIEAQFIKPRETHSLNRQFSLQLTGSQKGQIINQLPLQFRRRLFQKYSKVYSGQLIEDEYAQYIVNNTEITFYDLKLPGSFVEAIACDRNLAKSLVQIIQHTVGYPAFSQTIKGLITAGFVKSAKYAWEKKLKSWYRK